MFTESRSSTCYVVVATVTVDRHQSLLIQPPRPPIIKPNHLTSTTQPDLTPPLLLRPPIHTHVIHLDPPSTHAHPSWPPNTHVAIHIHPSTGDIAEQRQALRLEGTKTAARRSSAPAGTLQSGGGFGILADDVPWRLPAAGSIGPAGNQTVASLSDLGGSGGKVMDNTASSTAILTLAPSAGTTTFSGTCAKLYPRCGTLARA